MSALHRVLIQETRERGIRLIAEGPHLIVDAPKGALIPELREALSRHKAEILAILEAQSHDLREIYEERAAIMEHAGGLPRQEAEREAKRIAWRYACQRGVANGVFIAALEDPEAVKAVLQDTHGAPVVRLERVDQKN
jgi:hypothetical protein